MYRKLDETFYVLFTTRSFSTGAPTTLAGTPVVSAYEDNSLTQITAGITLGVDHDSVTGLNLLTIVATNANGYEKDKDYSLVITTGTVGGVSVVGEVVGSFSLGTQTADVTAISGDETAADNLELQYDGTGLTGDTFPATQQQVGNLTSGSAAINTVAESYTLTTGVQTSGTFADTAEEDGTYHIIEDTANNTEFYYQFDVGGNGVPVSVTWVGYAQGNNDSYSIFAYNWSGTAWQQIGTIDGANGTTPVTKSFDLTNAHVGTGANLGKVRFRYLSTDGIAMATDRILCSYAVVNQSVGYADGAIWVDTVNGTAGTVAYVNGTADNPVSTWADAVTLSGTLGLERFRVTSNSSITLSGNSDNYEIIGVGANLDLNSQSFDAGRVQGMVVTGTCTASGNTVVFDSCSMGTCTLPPCYLLECGLTTTVTWGSAGDFFIVDCFSQVAGASTPTIDMGGAIGATNLSIRRFGGGLALTNMLTGDVVSAEATVGGTLSVNGTGGSVEARGQWEGLNDLSGAAVTIDNQIINRANINSEVNDVIYVDANPEPTGIPSATAPLGEKIGYQHMALRNRVDVTSTAKTFYDDAGTAEFKKVLSDDGTTYSEAEASNP